ncbi:MAG TPA: NAD-dependent epimerase/dehydratase, partial [Bacteroidia bacterium]|nr:NAD-dependent epimerase/dehydratase [Bacteroidia bacterium]
MKILITGGAGYIGAELSKSLAAQKEVTQIIVYDNLSRANYNLFFGEAVFKNKLQFIQADILDNRSLRKALKDVDVVYHLAAKVTTPFSNLDASQFEQINHWGTADLVYALEENDIKKFVFISSSAVYGHSAEMVDELTPTNPMGFYGISKLRAEGHVMRLFDNMHTIILRCSNVYGYSTNMRFDAV